MQTFTGLEYILIDIANNYGHDKWLWDDRIQWAKDKILPFMHEEDFIDTMMEEAENPFLFRKALYAYQDAIAGKPTGFIMPLDATASGLQIIAALTGCKDTAKNVNLINTGKREDVYQSAAGIMSDFLGETITKSDIKKPLMTTFYGSLEQPKQVFGEGTDALNAFYKALVKMTPGGMEYLAQSQKCWQPNALEHSWKLPDNHHVCVKVMARRESKIEVDELNHATYTYIYYENEGQKKGISLAANIIHSIDGYIVREMVRRAHKQGFEILTIHDSFWASPNHMNQVRQNYIDILCEIADSDLLGSILGQITCTEGYYAKRCDDLSTHIKQAEYALS